MTVRGLVPRILINVVPALILFLVCKSVLHTADLIAILTSSIPAVIYALVEIVYQRRFDLFSALILLTITLGVILSLFSGNPRFYFLRHEPMTFLLGMAAEISLFFPKPLAFYVGRYFLTGNDPSNITQFNTQWQYPYFRTAMRLMTLLWGVFQLSFLAIDVPLVFILPIPFLLVVHSITGFVFFSAITGWIIFYARRIVKRLDEIKKTTADTDLRSHGQCSKRETRSQSKIPSPVRLVPLGQAQRLHADRYDALVS